MVSSVKNTLLTGLAVTGTAIALSVISTAPVHALVLVQYGFDTNLSPTSTASGVSGTAITAGTPPGGSGITYSMGRVGDGTAIDGNALLFDRTPSVSVTSLNAAQANNAYFEFTVQPSSSTLTLESLTFRARNTFTNSGSFAVASSLNNYGTTLLNNSISNTYSTFSAPLSAAFQNLSAPVTFRVYSWDTGGFATTGLLTDTVQVDGTVTPTPVPFGFVPLPGLLLAWGASRGRKALKQKLAKATASAS